MKLYITIPEGELRESFLDSTSMKTLEENFDVEKNESGRNLTEEELAVAAKDFDVLVTGWGTANLKKAGLTDKGTRLSFSYIRAEALATLSILLHMITDLQLSAVTVYMPVQLRRELLLISSRD